MIKREAQEVDEVLAKSTHVLVGTSGAVKYDRALMVTAWRELDSGPESADAFVDIMLTWDQAQTLRDQLDAALVRRGEGK